MCVVFVILNNTHSNLVTELYTYVFNAVHTAMSFSIICCKIHESLLTVKASNDTALNLNPSYKRNREEMIIQLNKFYIPS